jgi:nucleoid-associated protein YgaU
MQVTPTEVHHEKPRPPIAHARHGVARDPIDAAASLCRLAASLALAYLVLAAAVLLASGLLSTACVHRLAATLNPAPVAGLLTAAAVTAAPAAGASPAQVSGSGDGDAPRMELVQDLPTMTLLGSDGAGVASRPSSHPGPRPSGAGSRTAGDPASPAPPERQAAAAGTVVVRPGDNPWDIAARRMALALGRRPTDGEVRAYWKALLAANADRLVDPSDPGLILPGQELVLPG